MDTLYDVRLTREMAGRYAEVFPYAPATVVNTHHNGDHCWGNQVFEGAEIVAHRGCAERFSAFTPAGAQALKALPDPPPQLRDLQEEMAEFDFSEVVLTPPTRVVDGDVRLQIGDVRVEFVYVGPAHTEGDLVAWLPDDGVAFMGDVLFHRCTPIGWEGSTAHWLDALRRIEALEPQHVVPGHGPVGDAEALASARRYLEDVQAHAAAGWAAGTPVLDCCLAMDLGPYAGWGEPWRLAATVHRVYRECAGASWDDAFDGTAVMADVHALRSRWAG